MKSKIALLKAAPVRDIMTIEDLADFLAISTDTAYMYASTKFVPGFKLGNRWRFSRKAIEAWVEKQQETA